VVLVPVSQFGPAKLLPHPQL